MNYIKEVLFAAIVCGIISRLAPDSETGGGRLVRYAAVIAFLCVLAMPFTQKLSALSDFVSGILEIEDAAVTDVEANGSETPKSTIEIISQEICKAAGKAAAEHFSVSADAFKLRLRLKGSDSSELRISEATVYLSADSGISDIVAVEDYFSDILSCEVEVEKDE